MENQAMRLGRASPSSVFGSYPAKGTPFSNQPRTHAKHTSGDIAPSGTCTDAGADFKRNHQSGDSSSRAGVIRAAAEDGQSPCATRIFSRKIHKNNKGGGK
jgi:hypothetical protein